MITGHRRPIRDCYNQYLNRPFAGGGGDSEPRAMLTEVKEFFKREMREERRIRKGHKDRDQSPARCMEREGKSRPEWTWERHENITIIYICLA